MPLETGANPDDGRCIEQAADRRDHRCLELLLARGARVAGCSALGAAAHAGDAEAVSRLIDALDPDPAMHARQRTGWPTPAPPTPPAMVSHLRADGSSSFAVDGSLRGIGDCGVVIAEDRDGTVRMAVTDRFLSKSKEVLWLVTGESNARSLERLCRGGPTAPAVHVACDRMRVVSDVEAARLVAAQAPPHVHLWHRGTVVGATGAAV